MLLTHSFSPQIILNINPDGGIFEADPYRKEAMAFATKKQVLALPSSPLPTHI
jgi:hypothetical protein